LMTMISVRVDEELRRRMREHPSVNWSDYIRESIEERIRDEEMRAAAEAMDRLAEKTSGDWSGADEVRRWRDRRGD